MECVLAADDRSDPGPLRRTGEMPAGTELILLEVSELSLARLAGGVRSAIIGDSCGRGSTGREICYASNMQIFLETDRQCVDTDTDTHTTIYSISAAPSWFSASCVIPVASKISSKLVKDWLCPPELRVSTVCMCVRGGGGGGGEAQ